MISPWGMRGKGVAYADRPVVRAVPRHAARAVQDSSMVLASWQAGASPGLPGRSVERNYALMVLRCDASRSH
jgi:hypothetical protein